MLRASQCICLCCPGPLCHAGREAGWVLDITYLLHYSSTPQHKAQLEGEKFFVLTVLAGPVTNGVAPQLLEMLLWAGQSSCVSLALTIVI